MKDPCSNYHGGASTSLAAYESVVEGQREAQRATIIKLIAHSENGLTCDEVEVLTGMPHQTASARITELLKGKHIHFREGMTRATRTGRQARVYFTQATSLRQQDLFGGAPDTRRWDH